MVYAHFVLSVENSVCGIMQAASNILLCDVCCICTYYIQLMPILELAVCTVLAYRFKIWSLMFQDNVLSVLKCAGGNNTLRITKIFTLFIHLGIKVVASYFFRFLQQL